MTATQLLRRAALDSGPTITPTPWKDTMPQHGGKTKKRVLKDYQGVVDGQITAELHDPTGIEHVEDACCWLCGGETSGRGALVKVAVKGTFTDANLAKAPWSKSLCSGCVFATSWRELRMYSLYVASGKLHFPTRKEWRVILAAPPKPPYLAILAISGQKWLHFKGRAGVSDQWWDVMLEESPIRFDADGFRTVIDPVERLYRTFAKAEIESGQYQQHRIKEYGIAEWERDEAAITRQRRSRLFDLVLFVAQKPEEG